MENVSVTQEMFCEDRQGRTFADVLNDPHQPMQAVFDFFACPERQRRMEDAEIHHDRPPLAGVIREFEALPAVEDYLGSQSRPQTKRLRQAVGVLVRMIMELRGWKKTGRKGSLGVRAAATPENSERGVHNTGGLAFWFLRAERYERQGGMPYRSVRERAQTADRPPDNEQATHGTQAGNGRPAAKH